MYWRSPSHAPHRPLVLRLRAQRQDSQAPTVPATARLRLLESAIVGGQSAAPPSADLRQDQKAQDLDLLGPPPCFPKEARQRLGAAGRAAKAPYLPFFRQTP